MDPITSIFFIGAISLAPAISRSTWNLTLVPKVETTYVVNRRATIREEVITINEPVFAELLSYKNFQDGWDGEGSSGPSPADIESAIAFLEMMRPHLPLPGAMLSYEGEVGLYWNTPNLYIDINFEIDGTLSIYSRDRSTQPNTEKFLSGLDPKDIRTLLPLQDLISPSPLPLAA